MKRFIVCSLCVSVFFIGIGAVADGVTASFRSDQKALEIIAKSRQAIGGDAALAEVRSMIIIGRSTHTVKIDGSDRVEQGETELVMQLPDKLMKMVKIGNGDALAAGERHVTKSSNVVVMRKGDGEVVNFEGRDGEFTTADGNKVIVRRAEPGTGEIVSPDGKKFIFRKGDGETGEFTTDDGKKIAIRTLPDNGETIALTDGAGTLDTEKVIIRGTGRGAVHAGSHNNELLRTALMLLLKAPEGMDVAYTYEGEGNIDGTAVNIVAASFAGSVYRLHIDKYTDLPVALGYKSNQMPRLVRLSRDGSETSVEEKEPMIFTRKLDGLGEATEFLVKLSDFRSMDGVQLPYRWSTTTGGRTTEIFEVTSYEINPANIAERFSSDKVKIRMERSPEK